MIPGHKLVIIKDNELPTILVSPSGIENRIFFDKYNVDTKIEELLQKIIFACQGYMKDAKIDETKLTFSPYDFGLNILNLKTQTIHSLSNFDIPGIRWLPLVINEKTSVFESLFEKTKLLFRQENQSFLLKDFCGTEDPNLAKSYLVNPNKRKQSTGIIKNYLDFDFLNNSNCYLSPLNFDFKFKEWDFEEADKFFIALTEEGIILNDTDMLAWKNYAIDHYSHDIANKINTYYMSMKEKQIFENNVANSNVINSKLKI